MSFLKRLSVPVTNETKEIDVVQLWEVRWRSRYGEYSGDVTPEVEGFDNEQQALEFKVAIESAFKLLRFTSPEGISVTLKKAR